MATRLKSIAFSCVALLTAPALADESSSSSTPLNVGIGLGLNYAGIGVNAEYMLAKRWAVTGSIGYAGDHSGVVGLVGGVRYYFSTNGAFKPRLALAIGSIPATLCSDQVCDDERIDVYGASIGFRYKHFDLDVGYWRSNDIDDFVDDVDGNLKNDGGFDISLGYRF